MTEVTSDIRVFPHHVRAAKICMRGARAFFAKHGLDYMDFLSNGIPVSTLREIGDPIALRAADQAIAEAGNGR